MEELYAHFLKHPFVSTDSRQLPPGCIFFALKGDRFDGNAFAADALDKGASLVVADAPELKGRKGIFWVDDALRALQDLARHHRRQFLIPMIAITGSNGKTTTKELVGAVLKSHYRTHVTQGNLNNHIGVPLTLLAMPPDAEVAVIEMGANRRGDIAELCRIAEPTHGLITNIGKAHLEGFGGLEGVKAGKSELYRFLQSRNGVVFLNKDEPFLAELAQGVKRVIPYGLSDRPGQTPGLLDVSLIADAPFLQMAFPGPGTATTTVQTQLIGRYNVGNVATAIALGKYFKTPSQKIKEAIEAYVPANMRSQIVQTATNTVVLDAYNANPTSMRNALETFAAAPAANKAVILGDMLELGADADAEHREILKLAFEKKFQQIILVGPLFEKTGAGDSALRFPDVDSLKKWIAENPFSQTHILLKGSRRIGLEQLMPAL
jgi:UDP-N-acetylmuramoyl-tripeptide--D-alanyl-D-alanine ligase